MGGIPSGTSYKDFGYPTPYFRPAIHTLVLRGRRPAKPMESVWTRERLFAGVSPLFKADTMRLESRNGFRTMAKKVIYEHDKQRARLRFLIRHLIRLVNELPFPISSPRGAAAHIELSLLLVLEMTDWACVVKRRAFSEEKEWRVITYPAGATLRGVTPENYKGISIRPTSKLLLPYMTLEPNSRRKLPLVGVRCGPSEFQEQSSRAMRILLSNAGYETVPVTFSGAPLRV